MTTLDGLGASEIRLDPSIVSESVAEQQLLARIATRDAVVAVIGLGYVGLPLAVSYAKAGFRVVGVDVNDERVRQLQSGSSPIPDVPSEELVGLLAPLTVIGDGTATYELVDHRTSGHGSLSFSSDVSVLAAVDAVIICVPTPLSKSKDPDMSYIVSATETIARYLHPGMLVTLESTTYPGTTEEIIMPILERPVAARRRRTGDGPAEFERPSLMVGQDFFLAFSPERIDPGRVDFTVQTTPKVIGGVTAACLNAAKALYETAIDHVVPVSTPGTAEMVKLLENTFRAVNIALVNELAMMCDRLDIDVWEVIAAAKTKPFGFMAFQPGPGLGGHCIPVDPHYLAWKLRTLDYTARTIQLAAEINAEMPEYVMEKVTRTLNRHSKSVRGSRVLVLGIAYKSDVTDVRESPALDLIHLLLEHGAEVVHHDDFVPAITVDGVHLTSVPLDVEQLELADIVVIETAHSNLDWSLVGRHAQVIVDTRNVMAGVNGTRCSVVKL